jgi:hypothetical protein
MKSIAHSTLLLLVATLAFAQSESGRATLEGRVSDASGRVLQDAHISARETSTGLVRQVVSNAEGQFRIGALPVGSYRIQVSAPGFATGVFENFSLTVGGTKTLT